MMSHRPPAGEDPDRHLARRFSRAVKEDGVLESGDTIVVALSGGVDSSVLLHLLRFSDQLPPIQLQAAHFDHRMRPGSEGEALWVKGLCRAWRVPLHTGISDEVPGSEEEARDLRYSFLVEVREREKASWVLTAHQADDQAETVLFRIFRGTGLRGLAGIPKQRTPGFYRPLLGFSRHELLTYARRMKVRFLEDPSNRSLVAARNRIRNQVLPELEAGPAPRIRESLRRLARLAEENEAAWESLLPGLLDGVHTEEGGQVFVVRSGLLAYDPALQTRLMREILTRSGVELDEVGTRGLMEFTRTGASGRAFSLPGGARFVRDFERFRLEVPGVQESAGELGVGAKRERSGTLLISGPETGSGAVCLGGKSFRIEWGASEPSGCGQVLAIPISDAVFPLTFRGWVAGDRIKLDYGTKKLKKLFGEAKVPQEDREKIPVLVDAEGNVLWVAGFASSALVKPRDGSGVLFLGIRNVDWN